jgi:hypothetical protein
MGLAIFYLVLLALTEHLGFTLAYLIAALASVALNGFYLSHVLGGPKQGMGFAALLGLVYAILFGLLQAEETALLLGALLLFATLALVMGLTRKLDWYQVMENSPSATAWAAPSHRPVTPAISHKQKNRRPRAPVCISLIGHHFFLTGRGQFGMWRWGTRVITSSFSATSLVMVEPAPGSPPCRSAPAPPAGYRSRRRHRPR